MYTIRQFSFARPKENWQKENDGEIELYWAQGTVKFCATILSPFE